MAFTGQPGSPDAQPANIVLGDVADVVGTPISFVGVVSSPLSFVGRAGQ